MDYLEMAAKLDAVRKEIRINLPHLALLDYLSEVVSFANEVKLWQASANKI